MIDIISLKRPFKLLSILIFKSVSGLKDLMSPGMDERVPIILETQKIRKGTRYVVALVIVVFYYSSYDQMC